MSSETRAAFYCKIPNCYIF